MIHPALLSVAIAGATLAILSGCDASGGGPNSSGTPPVLPPPTEVAGSCDQNIDDRLAAGVGYCYETSMDSFDGTAIAMQIFVPQPEKRLALSNNAAPGFAPLIIHSHGYGGTKAEDFSPPGTELDRQVALDLWQAGYWVISFTQRGFGGIDGSELASGGQIGLMAPDKEGWDFVRVVDWAICHLREAAPLQNASDTQNADPEYDQCGQGPDSQWGASLLATDAGTRLASFDDDVALGTLGYSYGGGFQFNAQSVDPRVDAILPMGTWHDLRTSLHPNDTPKTAWITIMTAFGSPVPGVGGGNGQPLPAIIVDANTEAEGLNRDVADAPYNKARQVSVRNANILAPNGAVAYCDGHAQYYADKFGDADGEPLALDAPERPAHAAAARMPRADIFMIQGYGDTLFPMGEGYDNARCFEDAGQDAYYLGETSGHPLPYLGPDHYAGVDTSMYLDEIVHCGVGGNGEPLRYNTRTLSKQWFDAKLRGVGDFAAIFPHKACITQQNADEALVLDTSDPYFNNGTTNSASTAFKWSREGATFARIADIPVGGAEFPVPDTSLITGPGSLAQGAEFDFRITFVPLTTIQTPTVMAGIPTANLAISRANPLADEIFYAGVAVQRCQANPLPDQDPTNCQGMSPELLHLQAMPIRVFSTDAAGSSEATYPADDPRNFPGSASGHSYAIRWGDNPQDQTKGRLHGVTARLYPGDQVGLMLMPEHPVYTSVFSPLVGQVSVSGSIELPFVSAANPAPAAIPTYVLSQ